MIQMRLEIAAAELIVKHSTTYHSGIFYSISAASKAMAATPSMAMLQWLLQLVLCCRSVVIAVAATSHSGTVFISANVFLVTIASSVVSISALIIIR